MSSRCLLGIRQITNSNLDSARLAQCFRPLPRFPSLLPLPSHNSIGYPPSCFLTIRFSSLLDDMLRYVCVLVPICFTSERRIPRYRTLTGKKLRTAYGTGHQKRNIGPDPYPESAGILCDDSREGLASSVAWSPDGKTLASGHLWRVRLWDTDHQWTRDSVD
jgi:hypothetical protein